MEILPIILISVALTVVLSLLFGSFLYKRKISRNKSVNEEKAKLIIREAELKAENIKKDRILEAKEKLLKMKKELEEESNRKKNQIVPHEQKIKQPEAQLSK